MGKSHFFWTLYHLQPPKTSRGQKEREGNSWRCDRATHGVAATWRLYGLDAQDVLQDSLAYPLTWSMYVGSKADGER